jgi:hypothetical protein
MNAIVFGLLAGVIFGAVDVATMIPMTFPDKKTALLGAFFNCFAIGFLVAVTRLPVAPWLRGLVVGLLVGIPSAIATKSYAPILASSAIGGAIIGLLAGRFVAA